MKALECCTGLNYGCHECPLEDIPCGKLLMKNALNIINHQKTELEKLRVDNNSLRSAANSYKIHYENVVKNFEEFARRAYIDNPFACRYCEHLVADSRTCLWKEEHEKNGESCFGKQFKYDLQKMVGDTE